MSSDRAWHMFTRDIRRSGKLGGQCCLKAHGTHVKTRQVGGIHNQHPELSPLHHEHTHGYGRGRGGAGSGDAPVRGSAPCPHDSRSFGDEGEQEEGLGSRIVCVHPHS